VKIFISGKITGLELEDAMLIFEKAEQSIQKGLPKAEIINPTKAVPFNESWDWEDYMKENIGLLIRCDAIYMLPNWRSSKGASLERMIAGKLGLTILMTD